MAFCPNCGKEVSAEAFSCPNCGHPLRQIQPVAKPAEPVSGLWWFVSFFLAWIGGLIAYFVLKDRNQKTAEHMLIFGIAWTFLGVIFMIALAGFLFGLFGAYTSTSVGVILPY